MSDIAIEFGWLELLLIFGWPGLIIGGVCGVAVWRTRRWAGALLGAALGCVAWFGVAFILKLA